MNITVGAIGFVCDQPSFLFKLTSAQCVLGSGVIVLIGAIAFAVPEFVSRSQRTQSIVSNIHTAIGIILTIWTTFQVVAVLENDDCISSLGQIYALIMIIVQFIISVRFVIDISPYPHQRPYAVIPDSPLPV